MRVCVLATSYPRSPKDHASVFVHGLCKGLAKKKVSIKAVVPHEKGLNLKESFDGVDLVRFRYFWPASLEQVAYGFGIPDNVRRKFWAKLGLPFFFIFFFFKALRESRGADIIHAHWEISAAVGLLVSWLYGIPIVLTVHRLVARKPWSRFLTRFLLSRLDRLHFNSTYTTKEALRLLRQIPPYDLIYPSVDVKVFSPGAPHRSFRAIFEIPSTSPVILGLGRLVEKKGFGYLIKSFAKIAKGAKEPSSPRLIIAGGGPLLQVLQDLANEMCPRGTVFFTNFILPEDVVSILRESTLMVAPSIVDSRGEVETLGTVLMEAMACGVPVIGSRVGGIPDVIEDEKSGLLVEPRSIDPLARAMQNLLQAPETRERFIQEGLGRVREHFSWDVAVEATLTSYHQILDQIKSENPN